MSERVRRLLEILATNPDDVKALRALLDAIHADPAARHILEDIRRWLR
jgi:hypothetical protein